MTVNLSRITRTASVGLVSLAAIACTPRPPYAADGNVFITDRPPKYGFRGTNSPDYKNQQAGQDKPKKQDTGEDPSKLHDRTGTDTADTGNKPSDAGTTPPPATDTPPASGDTGTANTSPPPATKPNSNLPFGTPVIGKKGYVYSPYASDKGMVDVADIPSGTKVECPYTGKVFRVP